MIQHSVPQAKNKMRKTVEAAQGSEIIEKLLESKLYEMLTNEEWQRVLTGKAVKELVPEDWG